MSPEHLSCRYRSSFFCGTVGFRTKNPGDQGHANEIGQARSPHLGHEIGPIDLDRPWADPEIIRNLLVGVSGHETFEHVALAVRKSGEAAFYLTAFGFALLLPVHRVEREPHGCQ